MGYELSRNLNGSAPSPGPLSIVERPTGSAASTGMPGAMNDMELAQRLGISRKTLQKWRSLGMGPPYLKLGSKVVYRAEDIEAYIQRCLRTHM